MASYDLIVLGAGGVGSAALFHAAQRGARALGIDRFCPPHGHGSSHGQTRIIRQAYFEHRDYVPLLLRAYELWRQAEQLSGRSLLRITGLLQVGESDGAVLSGVRSSAAQHGLTVEELSAAEAMTRWPGLRVPEHWSSLFEAAAGYLRVEDCVSTHLELAMRHGAEFMADEPVRSWRADGGGVCVETERRTLRAQRLIVTAGPWAAQLLVDIGVPLTVRRKPLFWFATRGPAYREDRGFPGFLFERPEGVFYGFPELVADGRASGQLKVAEHTGGRTVSDPALVDRRLDPGEQARVERFLTEHLPEVALERLDHQVCLYTMSPDEHFLVDRVPNCPQTVFAAGLSGHGFKFASVLGEALVQLALDGRSPLPIGFLSLARFQRN